MGNAALHLLMGRYADPHALPSRGGIHSLFNDTPGHVNEPYFLIQELGRKVHRGQSPATPASQAGHEH